MRFTPLVQSLTSFGSHHHRAAFKKFFALWIISLIPGLSSFILLSENQPQTAIGQFRAAFTPAEQFVYAVSFLSPTLYLIWERFEQREKFIASGRRSPNILATTPRGFGLVLLIALIVFAFTAVGFGAAKALASASSDTFQHRLGKFAVSASLWIYFYGVYCWYLTIVMSIDAEENDFESSLREQEDAVTVGLRQRIAEKGGIDHE